MLRIYVWNSSNSIVEASSLRPGQERQVRRMCFRVFDPDRGAWLREEPDLEGAWRLARMPARALGTPEREIKEVVPATPRIDAPEAAMTCEAFLADPRRQRSLEVDFGVHWRRLDDPGGSPWRVSWIEATGELNAVELSHGDPLTPENYERGSLS